MNRAVSFRFVPAAVTFLLICVSVLFLAAASTLVPASDKSPESRASILTTWLR
jgi:hypothetical protein